MANSNRRLGHDIGKRVATTWLAARKGIQVVIVDDLQLVLPVDSSVIRQQRAATSSRTAQANGDGRQSLRVRGVATQPLRPWILHGSHTKLSEFVQPQAKGARLDSSLSAARLAPRSLTGEWRSVNLGTMFGKIIKWAGLVAWPRAWHNLPSSRQMELTEKLPSHVVTAWLGNSERIAEKHYLQVLDAHFDRAIQDDANHETTFPKAAQIPAQLVSEPLGNASQALEAENDKPLVLLGNPTKQGVRESRGWAILDSNQ